MVFIDGENLTIRGQAVASQAGIQLQEGAFYKRNCFLWIPTKPAGDYIPSTHPDYARNATRACYYTSVCGDSIALDETRSALWKILFEPHVFKKERQQAKAKGVDIALTKDMLSHAFRDNYDIAVLYAGDGDYVPLVKEVKRVGKRVHLNFFSLGLSSELKHSVDHFFDITELFIQLWRSNPGHGPIRH
jgi:uncharacterized LabA/DUF88 family protein